ncbi:hypothetical protein DITRI_Ditri02bG0022700 [Diplodiscus trichospermus]
MGFIKLSGSLPSIVFLLFLVFSFLSIISRADDDDDDDDDSASMAKLAAALHPLPRTWSTNSSSSYCEWQGIDCNGTRRVVQINLHSMSLRRSLPSKFPPFPQLQVLNLSKNSFTGSIPSLDGLPLLKELDLRLNQFTRITMGVFQGLSRNLQVLNLGDNTFLASWRIPVALTNFTILTSFYAYNTNLLGSIPDIFDSLALTHLGLHDNNLTGALPASLGRSQIKYLWLQNQKLGLTGPIDLLSNMTSLSKVGLQYNRFSGAIPDLSNCKSLKLLQLHYNHLTGVFPQSLASHPSLEAIAVNDNMLQGPFPSYIFTIMNASIINNNFCTGAGDPCDPQVTKLLEIASALNYPYKLSLAWKGNDACNNWSFVTCDSRKNIKKIDLRKQQLKGTISPAFADLTWLKYLYLNDNNLTGSIPDSLTQLAYLKVLDVSYNNLSGVIPTFGPSVEVKTTGNYMLTEGTSNFPPKGKKQGIKVIVITAGILGTIMGAIFFSFLGRRIARNTERMGRSEEFKTEEACSKIFSHTMLGKSQNGVKFQELQLFDFGKLAAATNNFHPTNMLGKGGFGLVYKGKLQDGQEIAVKRLSRASVQGLEEFMNEAMVISKLQHRNLVKLLGCCIDGEEKMLVYEYMPNKSLDVFLFDSQKQKLLDWRKRFNIIEGISRGLLYFHRDSRLRIVHRDLKASNILLDEELNPKISDFGIAKIFGGNESHANTRRVFGTYGYMSPEYAMKGQFSEKSDVFSFGVLTLEIVSGRRNSSFHEDEHSLSLLGYAWKLWSENNILALIDPVMNLDPSFHREVSRCIHVGLLCVQNFAKDRPTMSTVASMLSSEIENLPTPKQPPFIDERTPMDHSQSQTSQISCIIDYNFTAEIC